MIRIVLDSEQAKMVAKSHEAIEVCDESGKILGVMNPHISPDELVQIAEIKRRLARPQPRYTAAEVLERLEKLPPEMRRFNVALIEDAEGDLAGIWIDAPDRDVIRKAFNRIERELAEAPTRHGTRLSEGLWKIYREPLKAFFSIDETAKLVEISRLQFIPSSET